MTMRLRYGRSVTLTIDKGKTCQCQKCKMFSSTRFHWAIMCAGIALNGRQFDKQLKIVFNFTLHYLNMSLLILYGNIRQIPTQ